MTQNVETFLNETLPTFELREFNCLDRFIVKIFLNVRFHPTAKKASCVFFLLLGIGLLASLPWSHQLGSWVVPTISSIGSFDILVSLVALGTLGFLRFIVPAHHPMTKHVYKEQEVEIDGAKGRLKYEGDLPVITIENAGIDRRRDGKIYARLSAEKISSLIRIFRFCLYDLGPLVGFGLPRPHEFKDEIEKLKNEFIPDEYLEEMKGFVEEYNQYCKEHGKTKQVTTLEEMILLQLIPEITHFNFFKNKSSANLVGCCVIVTKDKDEMLVERNLDWTSPLELLGTNTVVIRREFQDRTTSEIGNTGMFGPTTGIQYSKDDKTNLVVAMNVTDPGFYRKTKQINGVPAIFLNRKILEECTTVKDAKNFLSQPEKTNSLGPYHLTVVDPKEATIFHMRQLDGAKHYIRNLGEGDDASYLCTTNPHYINGFRWGEMFMSKEREEHIKFCLEDAEKNIDPDSKWKAPVLKELIQHYPDCNHETTYSCFINLTTGEEEHKYDNSFAAKQKLKK